jgi:hypothetical protein
MTVKKSLENRIRGWFPHEPNITKSSAKQDFQVNQQGLSFRQKIDKIGWILIFISLFFLLFSLGSSILMFPDRYSKWSGISMTIGSSFTLIFIFYNQRRLNRMKNKQNASELRA